MGAASTSRFTLGQLLEAHALPEGSPTQAALLAHVVNLGLLQHVTLHSENKDL